MGQIRTCPLGVQTTAILPVSYTHLYTGEYGPLANSIEVGKSIRIKYDPNAPENSTGILAPGGNDLALVIIGTILAVPGFFMTGILGLLRRLLRGQMCIRDRGRVGAPGGQRRLTLRTPCELQCHSETSPQTGRGERTERCQWQKQRSERVAAVKISSVCRKAAQKFWAPQQGHP